MTALDHQRDLSRLAPDADRRSDNAAADGLDVVAAAWPKLPGDVRRLIVSVVRRTREARQRGLDHGEMHEERSDAAPDTRRQS